MVRHPDLILRVRRFTITTLQTAPPLMIGVPLIGLMDIEAG